MKIYKIKQIQKLNIDIEEAWDFFSSPLNLDDMTPKNMNFKILNLEENKMYEGQIVKYNIEVFPKIYLDWVSELKGIINEKNYKQFIDNQKFGPYKMWHHIHKLEKENKFVKMTDLVYYIMPFGLFGQFVHKFLIKKRLDFIFKFRYDFLENRFNHNIKVK